MVQFLSCQSLSPATETPLWVLHRCLWSGTVLSGLIRDESWLWNRSESSTTLYASIRSSRQGRAVWNKYAFALAHLTSPHWTELSSQISFASFLIIILCSKAILWDSIILPSKYCWENLTMLLILKLTLQVSIHRCWTDVVWIPWHWR